MSRHQSTLPEKIAGAIREAVRAGSVMLHNPSFIGKKWLYLRECLDSIFVSSVGNFVDRFKVGLVRFTGSKHAVAVVNSSAALHMTLKLEGVTTVGQVLTSRSLLLLPRMQSPIVKPCFILSIARNVRRVLMLTNCAPDFSATPNNAVVSATILAGIIVMHGAIENAGAKIENNYIINTRALIQHNAVVEGRYHIFTGAILNGGARVGIDSFIGSGRVVKEGLSISMDGLVGIGLTVRHELADYARFTGHAIS